MSKKTDLEQRINPYAAPVKDYNSIEDLHASRQFYVTLAKVYIWSPLALVIVDALGVVDAVGREIGRHDLHQVIARIFNYSLALIPPVICCIFMIERYENKIKELNQK